MIRRCLTWMLAALAAGASAASAQVVLADNGEQKVSLGAYLQAQYRRVEVADAEPRDEAIFRRMVVTLGAVATRNWHATFQIDVAPATEGDRVVVKDATLQYVGWQDRGLTLTLGNQKTPFSHSVMTSSSKRGLVERSVPGDRSLGALGRALGIRLDGSSRSETYSWSAEIASSLHSPLVFQVRTDGIAEAGPDWNEGVLGVARLEFHPRGAIARTQSATPDGDWKYTVAMAGYAWDNDGDRNLYTSDGRSISATHADTSRVNGVEAAAGLRAARLWLDAEFQRIASRTIDPHFTGGLYESGRATLVKAGIETGYRIGATPIELAGAYDVVDADTYARPWQRVALGGNWYIHGHEVKFQAMYRYSIDTRGIAGVGEHQAFLQAQIGF